MNASCRSRRPDSPLRSARAGCTNRALLVVAISGLCLGRASEADARAPAAARLVWDGSVCGSAEDFAARVGTRTNAVRFVPRGQRLVVRARIERRGDGLEASAIIEARGRAPIVRRLQSPDCDDALDALALVVAIGVEGRSSPARPAPRVPRRRAPPEAQPTPPSASPPEPSTPDVGTEPDVPSKAAAPTPNSVPPPTPPSALQPAATETLTPEAGEVRAPLTPAPSESRAPGESNTPSPAGMLEMGAGLAASMSIGVAPDALWGGALWLSVGWARAGVWSPEIVASAEYQRLDGLSRPSGLADFALSAGSVSLCPLRLGSEAVAVRPCASGAIGWLAAEGYDTFDASSATRPWGAAGGSLQGVARAGSFELRAVLGALAPLSRDSFAFGGRCLDASACEADVFHHVAPVIWSGAVGAGIRIW